MGKKKKLNKKRLNKLHKKLHETNEYVTREEFLVASFSKQMREMYESLPPERQKSLLQYIQDDEDWKATKHLRDIEVDEDDDDRYVKQKPIIAHGIHDFIEKRAKFEKRKKKKKKRKYSRVIKDSEGLLRLANPESFDSIVMKDKDFRKAISKLAKDAKANMPTEIDFSMDDFKKQMMKSDSVNSIVMNNFFNTHGY